MNSFLQEFIKTRKDINKQVPQPAPQDKRTKSRNSTIEAVNPIGGGLAHIIENKPPAKVVQEFLAERIAELSAKKI
jgi:hypothetical protein